MFGSATLDAVIVLAALYGVLSVAGVFVVELVSVASDRRTRMLKEAISIMIHDETGHNLTRDLYDHPAIACLASRRRPTHIPPRNFAMALLDLVMQPGFRYQASVAFPPPGLGMPIRAAVDAIPDPWMMRLMTGLADVAGDDPVRFRQVVEEWFESTMIEVSRRYRTWAQAAAFTFALVASLGMNIDTFAVISFDAAENTLRQSLVASAEEAATQPPTTATQSPAPYLDSLRVLTPTKRLPIGWSRQDFRQLDTGASLLSFLAGIFFTAAIVALLTPVWFDILKRVTLRVAEPLALSSDAERYRPTAGVITSTLSSPPRSRFPPS